MKRTTVLTIILVLLNIITAFILSIVANKVSELVIIPSNYLLFATIGTISIAFLLGILLDYREHLKSSNWNSNPIRSLSNRVITVFPMALGVGALTGYICFILIPEGHPFYFYSSPKAFGYYDFHFGPWNFEIFGFLAGIVTLYAMKRIQNNIVLSSSYSIGFGSSIGLVFFKLYPEISTILLPTLVIWNFLFLSIVIILHTNTTEKVVQFLNTVLGFLTKVR